MNLNCFICNKPSLRNTTNLFGDDGALKSGKRLCETLIDIIEKPVKEDSVHSTIVCKKCYKTCMEYDEIKSRLQSIKQELLESFKDTLIKNSLDYDTYDKTINAVANLNSSNTEKKVERKTLVLPASKLQPLPPDFVIKMGNLPIVSKQNMPFKKTVMIPTPSTLNLKVTVGSSVLTQSIKTTGAISNILQKGAAIALPRTQNNVQSDLPANILLGQSKGKENAAEEQTASISERTLSIDGTGSSILSFNVDDLPKDFMSSTVLTKLVDEVRQEELENDDEQPMEIDEDCSYAMIQTSDSNVEFKVLEEITEKSVNDVTTDDHNYLDVNLLPLADGARGDDSDGCAPGKYVLSKLKILHEGGVADGGDDDEEDEQTIVMEGENGSILRVVAGRKLVYDGNEISLVVGRPDRTGRSDADDNADSQDSNEESQIELQVSGDEETANAIIAAAQEQGGAFIKVESGEMYRVKSVQSTTTDEGGDDVSYAMPIVEREGNLFKCLLCEKKQNKENESGEADGGEEGGSDREAGGSGRVLLDAEQMMRHVRGSHRARLYICRVCGEMRRRRSDHIAHMAAHAQNKIELSSIGKARLYECDVCHKKYSSSTLLADHANVHSGARPYQCHVCAKTFASKYTHQAHLKIHMDRPRPFKCKDCGKSFFTQQNLNQHEKTHSGTKDFVCNVCGKAFGTQHNLEVHGVVHSGRRPYVCGVCGKGFARRAEVRDHMRIHTGERPFSCDTCGATFSQRSNLLSHRRATHLDDKRYGCDQCDKRFKRRRLLEYHVKACHTGERPLVCGVCRASFVYPEHYKKHVRIHSGEKPYVCEVCGKSFNSRDNRNTHRFVHSDKKPYECLVCGAGYMRKQLLYAHMNASGHIAESIVVNQPRVAKVEDSLIATQPLVVDTKKVKPGYTDAIFTSSEELELDASGAKSVDKSTLNLVQDGEEPTFLTIHNIEGVKAEGVLQDAAVDPLAEPAAQIVSGSMVQLVQIQLPDGNNGWVAINP